MIRARTTRRRALVALRIVVMAAAGLPLAGPVPADATPGCPGDGRIAYGDTVRCSIAQTNGTGTHTFDAQPGDVVVARMAAIATTAGTLRPTFRFETASGGVVCQLEPQATTFGEGTCRIVGSGEHRLVVSDHTTARDWTGDYQLHMQSANRPGRATDLAFGQTVSGTISFATELDAFTFQARAGDRMLERLARVNSIGTIQARVFTPGGTAACPIIGSSGSGDAACELGFDGSYTVLVGDQTTATPAYGYHLQRLNDPGGASALQLGLGATGSIGSPSEADAFTFAAVAGDRILVRMGPAGSSAGSFVRLFDAAGSELCAAQAGGGVVEVICAVAPAGPVTAIAAGYPAEATGGYSLFAQSLREPGNAGALTMGVASSGHISRTTNLGTHTFDAEPGERFVVRVAEGSSPMTADIRVFGPRGEHVCADFHWTVADTLCRAVAGGRHTVLAASAAAGTYGVFAQRTAKPVGAVPLVLGRSVEGALTDLAESHSYSHDGYGGQLLAATGAERDGSGIWAMVRIFDPEGQLVCGGQHGASCRLRSGGVHHVFIDDISAETGGYTLLATVPAVNITESGGSTQLAERGATDTYAIALMTRPASTVTVSLAPDAQVSTSVSQVVFTTNNWQSPQTVTVRAVDDTVPEAPVHEGRIVHTVSSGDGDYDRTAVPDVIASIVDNDASGLALLRSGSASRIPERDGVTRYTVGLTKQPSAEVRVHVRPDSQVTASAELLRFTPLNWETTQSIEVRVVDDGFDEPNPHPGVIAHLTESGDAAYDGIVAPLTILLDDDDLPLEYFALGDSVASGHGLADDGGVCKRSGRAYPLGVAAALGATRTVEMTHLACSGSVAVPQGGEPSDRLLSSQVEEMLARRTSTNPALVSISIGADELGLSDPIRARAMLCESADAAFEGSVLEKTAGLRAALLTQTRRLLGDPLVDVVASLQYQPMNSRPAYLDDPAFVGGVRVPCNRERAFDRAQFAVSALNDAIASIPADLSPGERTRFLLASPEAEFHGREGAAPGCGTDPPLEDSTWIQYPARGFTSTAGGDCFHVNEAGTAALADAVRAAGASISPDTTPPVCVVATAPDSVLLAAPAGQDQVVGAASDGQSGIASVVVTFTPHLPLSGPSTVSTSRKCQPGGRSCTWTAPPPSVPGRYAVSCVAKDRARNVSAVADGGSVLVL